MDWKQQFKVHDLSCRETFIVLLVIAVCEVILLLFIPPWQPNSETVSHFHCGGKQRWIYRIMSEVPDGDGFELPPEWTVADLIREAVRKDRQSPHPTPEKDFICRNVRDERVFLVRCRRVEVNSPYLVFPVPASVVFDESLQEPVPILMCPPGAHGGSGSKILYSDGTVEKLTTEEAERLVAEQHPIQLELKITGVERESEPGDEEAQIELNRLGAE